MVPVWSGVTNPIAFAPDGNALFLTRSGIVQSGPATMIWRAPDFAETDVSANVPVKEP